MPAGKGLVGAVGLRGCVSGCGEAAAVLRSGALGRAEGEAGGVEVVAGRAVAGPRRLRRRGVGLQGWQVLGDEEQAAAAGRDEGVAGVIQGVAGGGGVAVQGAAVVLEAAEELAFKEVLLDLGQEEPGAVSARVTASLRVGQGWGAGQGWGWGAGQGWGVGRGGERDRRGRRQNRTGPGAGQGGGARVVQGE